MCAPRAHQAMWRTACALVVPILVLSGSCSRPPVPRDLRQAAETALQEGRLPDALRQAEQGTRAFATDAQWAWTFRLLRSDVLLEAGNTSGAMEALTQPIPDAPELRPLRWRQSFLRAKAERNQGQLTQALGTLQDLDTELPPNDELRLASDWLKGQIALRLGRSESGERILLDVANRAAMARNRPQQALAYLDLGMSRLLRGRYDEALAWFERIPAFAELEGTTVTAKALNNAGICYARLGLFDRAVQAHEQAIAMERAGGASRPLAEALGSLGNTYALRGAPRAALPFLKEAYDVATQAEASRDAALWAVNLAAAHASLEDWDQTEEYNELSRKLGGERNGVKPAYLDLNAADVARGRGDLALSRALYRQALAASEGAAPIQWTAQVGLAQVAMAARQTDEAARFFEAALATVERTRAGLLKPDYRVAFLSQLIGFYQAYVDLLVEQGQSDRALEVADSSRGRVLAEQQRVDAPARATIATFRHLAARTNTVLLSYWLAPTRSFLWVVRASGVRRIDLPPAATIETAVREYRSLVDSSLADPIARNDTPGDRLYQMLLAPAALEPETSVVIVPDGALHGINFETLPVDGPRRHYFLADAQVQVAPSLAMLTLPPTRPREDAQRLLLIGNPTPRPPEYPALSYAQAEMTSIVRHFRQDRVSAYDSGRATPAVYQEAPLDRFSMIHFTAHATANVESPLDSAVVLSGPDAGFKLYAREVAERPLTAELVTVSACRSAGERAYSGEGLIGFAWAFLRAGAKRVVAGLWDVDDRSTAQLMDTLYAGISNGATPAASLRRAKLMLIEAGGQQARPYYWGPFQLFTVSP